MGEFGKVVGRGVFARLFDASWGKVTLRFHRGRQLLLTMSTLMLGSLLGLTSWPTLAVADNFAAIAFSQSSGSHGWSNDYNSRGGAEREALRGCGNADCTVVQWVRNACAALATGQGNSYGTGWASGRRRAEEIAMSNCNDRARNCSVIRWVCTTR